MDDLQILDFASDFIPVLLVLYRKRLTNGFSPFVQKSKVSTGKFLAVGKRGNRIEFRLFSRVKSFNQLEWRRRLLEILTKFAEFKIDPVANIDREKSELFNHLRKIYSADQIKNLKTGAVYARSLWISPEPVQFSNITRLSEWEV